jgi:hypothetical protein
MAFVATMDTCPPLHSSFLDLRTCPGECQSYYSVRTRPMAAFCIIFALGMAAESKGRACRLAVVRSASISALPLDQTISPMRVKSDPFKDEVAAQLSALRPVDALRDNSKLTSQIRCNGVVPFR